jgi:hypothetical protein
VVKNTLTKIAATEAGVAEQLDGLLTGPSAIAFVQGDVVEAAKGLRDFAKANPFLVIKGGVLDGKAITPAEIVQARRPGAARGAAGQAGRRHEGVDVGRRGHVRRAAGPDGGSWPRRCGLEEAPPPVSRRPPSDGSAADGGCLRRCPAERLQRRRLRPSQRLRLTP